MKIGICGVGRFGRCFVPLFKAHPLVDEIVLADGVPQRLRESATRFGVERAVDSLAELCRSDVDAIALFTQRHVHAPQTLEALDAGKHVYCAVPIAMDLEAIRAIVEKVERTQLIYMTGETSVYDPATIYCRGRFKAGNFGRFAYGEAQYLHDMSFFYDAFKSTGGPDWKRVAGVPPMYYPTHSLAMLLSVTGERVGEVACLGYEDRHEDEIFGAGRNDWDNPFSNEHALMRTTDGGVIRISEMRRVGWHHTDTAVYMSMFGTEGSFENTAMNRCWVDKTGDTPIDVSPHLACQGMVGHEHLGDHAHGRDIRPDEYAGVAEVHDTARLPEQFKGLPNGHSGSHQFLVDDFVKAVAAGTQPIGHVWDAANWMAPGLVAHDSATRGGEILKVPQFIRPSASGAPRATPS